MIDPFDAGEPRSRQQRALRDEPGVSPVPGAAETERTAQAVVLEGGPAFVALLEKLERIERAVWSLCWGLALLTNTDLKEENGYIT
jgi:hypothetical protein